MRFETFLFFNYEYVIACTFSHDSLVIQPKLVRNSKCQRMRCALCRLDAVTCEGYLGTGLFKGNKNADQPAQKRAKTPFMGPGQPAGLEGQQLMGLDGSVHFQVLEYLLMFIC